MPLAMALAPSPTPSILVVPHLSLWTLSALILFFFGAVDVLLRRNDSVSLVLCIVASYISGMSLWVISRVIITTNVVSRFMHLTRMF